MPEYLMQAFMLFKIFWMVLWMPVKKPKTFKNQWVSLQ